MMLVEIEDSVVHFTVEKQKLISAISRNFIARVDFTEQF